MATKPTTSRQESLQDIRSLLSQVTATVLKQWAAADKKKGKTGGVNAAFIAGLRGDVTALTKAKKVSTTGATAKEAAAREPLRAELRAIRDDVAEVFPDDTELKRAYGTGRNLGTNSTNALLEAADDVASAFKASGAKAKSAGVSAQRLAALEKLRAALEEADTGQRATSVEKQGATTQDAELLKSVLKRATLVRNKLKQSGAATAAKSTARRHAVKPRAKKAAGGEK